jgi:GxxExxY protein
VGKTVSGQLLNMMSESTKRDPETYAVIGAAMEVHRELKSGFLEAIYLDALTVEFSGCGVPFERERLLQVRYKGGILPSCYRVDFVCYGGLLVECKALSSLGGTEESQVLNYLRVTGFGRALLINFGSRSLEYRRYVYDPDRTSMKRCPSEADFRL